MPPPDVPPPVLDHQLLERFVQCQDEEAFAELARRYLNLVHAAARRQTPQAADDITQAVFLLLAQKAASLPRNRPVAGWLCQTTRFCCGHWNRDEALRRRHEREAAAMAQASAPDQTWQKLLPLLDESLAKLSASERDAVALRYLTGKSLAETGAELSITVDAVAKRAGRGLEKLRAFFAKRGYIVPAAAVATLLTAESAHAAPATLTVKVVVLGAHEAMVSAKTAAIAKGAMHMMTWAKMKLAAAAIGVAVITGGAGVVIIHQALAAPAQPPAVAPAPPVLAASGGAGTVPRPNAKPTLPAAPPGAAGSQRTASQGIDSGDGVLDWVLQRLEVSAGQLDKIGPELAAARPANRALRKEFLASLTELQPQMNQAVEDTPPMARPAIMTLSQQRTKLRQDNDKEVLRRRQELLGKIGPSLTAEQLAKLKNRLDEFSRPGGFNRLLVRFELRQLEAGYDVALTESQEDQVVAAVLAEPERQMIVQLMTFQKAWELWLQAPEANEDPQRESEIDEKRVKLTAESQLAIQMLRDTVDQVAKTPSKDNLHQPGPKGNSISPSGTSLDVPRGSAATQP